MNSDQWKSVTRHLRNASKLATPAPWSVRSGGGYISVGRCEDPKRVCPPIQGSTFNNPQSQAEVNYMLIADMRSSIDEIIDYGDAITAQRDDLLRAAEKLIKTASQDWRKIVITHEEYDGLREAIDKIKEARG